jgi:hypothetical protein
VQLDRAALALTVAVALGACAEETVELPDHEQTERACVRPYAWGHWEDGTKHIIGPDRHVCLCMTEAEFESGSRVAELNAMVLAECDEQAKKFDFAWTECQMWHDEQLWVGEDGHSITWPTDHVLYSPGAQLSCW